MDLKHLRHGQLGEKMQVDNENCLHAILQVFNLLFIFKSVKLKETLQTKGKGAHALHIEAKVR